MGRVVGKYLYAGIFVPCIPALVDMLLGFRYHTAQEIVRKLLMLIRIVSFACVVFPFVHVAVIQLEKRRGDSFLAPAAEHGAVGVGFGYNRRCIRVEKMLKRIYAVGKQKHLPCH